MNQPLPPIDKNSATITLTDTLNTALHLTLSKALEIALNEENYITCADLQSAIEDLEIKHLLQ